MCTICLKVQCELGIGAPKAGIEDMDPLAPDASNTLSVEADTPPGTANWEALDMGVNWYDYGLSASDPVVTYTVTESAAEYDTQTNPFAYPYANDEPEEYIDLSDAGEAIVRETFELWDALIAIELEDPTTNATTDDDDLVPTLRAGGSSVPSTAWAYGPGPVHESGDIWFNTDRSYLDRLVSGPEAYLGSYEFSTSMHEIGHALGLKHPHQSDPKLDADYDGLEYTVMSYRSYAGGPTNGYTVQDGSYPQSLMMLDIAMIQDHYGADYGTFAGDTVYTFDIATGEMFIDGAGQGDPVANKVFRTLWDGNGTDLIDLSNYTTDLEIDLTPGRGVDLDTGGFAQRALLDRSDGIYAPRHIYTALLHEGDTRSLIENANGGAGDDTFIGNAAANVFRPGGGDNFADGGDGIDTVALDMASGAVTVVREGGDLRLAYDGGSVLIRNVETVALTDLTIAVSALADALLADSISTPTALDVLLSEEPPVDTPAGDTPTGDISLADAALAAGAVLVEGAEGADRLRGEGPQSVLVGYAGDDWLWAGRAGEDNVHEGGAGADWFVFDLRTEQGTSYDIVADFDFAEGDAVTIRTSREGQFTDEADPANALWTSSDGSRVDLKSLADIAEAVASGALEATDGTHGLVLSLSGLEERMLELAGLSMADLNAAEDPPPEVADTSLGNAALAAGALLVEGTEGADTLRGSGPANVLLGYAGDDWLWAGDAGENNVHEGGAGADWFVFDLRTEQGTSYDIVADFDFAEGDAVTIRTSREGQFTDEADPANALWTSSDGSRVDLKSLADIAEAVASGALEVTDGTHGLVLSLSGLEERMLELAGLSTADLIAAEDPPPEVADTSLGNAALAAGALLVEGTEGADTLRGEGPQSVLVGYAGDDWLWAGDAGENNVYEGGAGADWFVFDLRREQGTSYDIVADFDFAEGDAVTIRTSREGQFTDEADPANALWTSSDGSRANIDSLADIAEAVASGALEATDGTHGLVLSLSGLEERMLELAGVYADDLFA